ncbi:hypothetical protein D3C85_514570 [compost metagenome]
MPDIHPRQVDVRAVEPNIQGFRHAGYAGFVVGGHPLLEGGQGGQTVQRATVQNRPAQRLGDAMRHRALAGRGGAIDRDDGSGGISR